MLSTTVDNNCVTKVLRWWARSPTSQADLDSFYSKSCRLEIFSQVNIRSRLLGEAISFQCDYNLMFESQKRRFLPCIFSVIMQFPTILARNFWRDIRTFFLRNRRWRSLTSLSKSMKIQFYPRLLGRYQIENAKNLSNGNPEMLKNGRRSTFSTKDTLFKCRKCKDGTQNLLLLQVLLFQYLFVWCAANETIYLRTVLSSCKCN